MKKIFHVLIVAIVIGVGCALSKPPLVREKEDEESYYEKALQWEKKGDILKAIGCIDESLKDEPGNAEFLWRKASYLAQDNDIDKAISFYKQSFYIEKNSSVAFCLAELLVSIGKYSEAEYYSYYITQKYPSYSPALILLTEVELALWHLKNAEACLALLEQQKIPHAFFAKEFERRKAVFSREGIGSLGGIKHYIYFKTGGVLTGISEDDGISISEAVLTLLDEDAIASMIGRTLELFRSMGVSIDAVIPVGAFNEGSLLAEIVLRLSKAEEIKKIGPHLKGKNILICMGSFKEDEELDVLVSLIKKNGGTPYLFTAGVARGAVRRCDFPPDISGVGGAVLLDPMNISIEKVISIIEQFNKDEAGEYVKRQLDFYAGKQDMVRIKEGR